MNFDAFGWIIPVASIPLAAICPSHYIIGTMFDRWGGIALGHKLFLLFLHIPVSIILIEVDFYNLTGCLLDAFVNRNPSVFEAYQKFALCGEASEVMFMKSSLDWWQGNMNATSWNASLTSCTVITGFFPSFPVHTCFFKKNIFIAVQLLTLANQLPLLFSIVFVSLLFPSSVAETPLHSSYWPTTPPLSKWQHSISSEPHVSAFELPKRHLLSLSLWTFAVWTLY